MTAVLEEVVGTTQLFWSSATYLPFLHPQQVMAMLWSWEQQVQSSITERHPKH
jgi:hypothetical protein